MSGVLDRVKLAMRYRNNMFDTEINGLTDACKADLVRLGVKETLIVSTDETIVHIMTCYCKWQLNYQGDGEKWGNLYRELRQDLSLDATYRDN